MYKNMTVIAVLNQMTSIINKMDVEQWLLLLTNICIFMESNKHSEIPFILKGVTIVQP